MENLIEKVKQGLENGKQLALGRIHVTDIRLHEGEILVKFRENQWQSIDRVDLEMLASQAYKAEKVRYDHIVKAGYIFTTLYFCTKPLYFHNQQIYAIRFVDQDERSINIFDPYEDNGVSITVPEGLQPTQCKFQVSPSESENGEEPLDAKWIDVPLGELEDLWFRALS
jgi:hypothetical protein